MAACVFGASGLKITNLDFGSVRPKFNTFKITLLCLKTSSSFVRFDDLILSRRSKNSVIRCPVAVSETDSTENSEDSYEETKSSDAISQFIPNSLEVESLLDVLCDTTSIAEFELKLGGFHLHVTRKLAEQIAADPEPLVSSPVTVPTVFDAPYSNGSASSQSLALTKPVSSSGRVQTLLDKAADEGLVIIYSPRVGYFRRCRTIKGKKAPPSCKEKDTVKEGQVLCYIEQLGGEIPIESDTAGEIVKILREDGDPVGYGDALIAVLPSFPGINIA